MELLIQMCWEDVPQIDEASLSAGAWRINQSLQIRSNAFALSGGCHLASHKTFDAKLLACYTQQYATDSGLRSPNLTMSADLLLMEKIYQVVNEENWNLHDAHEYSTVRRDRVAVLQPRPGPSSATPPMKGGKGQRERTQPPQRRESKGTSDRKGDKKGEGKGKSEGKNCLMEYWDKSPVCERDKSGRPDEAHLHARQSIAVHLAKMRFRSLLPLSQNLTVRCAAPQTAKRSRLLTARAESLIRDSSRHRKRRPVSGGHCPTRITSVPSQKDANSIHVPLKHNGRIRRFHWICHRGRRHHCQ